jgi:hypothetical protein
MRQERRRDRRDRPSPFGPERGSSAPADLPHLPLGSVAHKVLRLSRRPVIVVPGHRVTALAAAPAAPAAEAMPAPAAG